MSSFLAAMKLSSHFSVWTLVLGQQLGQDSADGAAGRFDSKQSRYGWRNVVHRDLLPISARFDARAEEDHRDVVVIVVGRSVRGSAVLEQVIGFLQDHEIARTGRIESQTHSAANIVTLHLAAQHLMPGINACNVF